MPDRAIEIDGQSRQVLFPPDPAVADRLGLVWHAHFVDETDGRSVPVRVRVSGDLAALSPASAPGGGRAGLVGVPADAFPDLPATPVPVTIQAEADGYLLHTLSDTITAHPNHPATFDPATPAAPVEMQPRPVRLEGRVHRRGAGGLAPVAGALVEITGIWPFAQIGDVIPPIDPAETVEIRPALTAPAPAGLALRRVNLGTPGPDTTLAESAPAGARALVLQSRAGLSTGHYLALEPAHPDRAEIVRIDSIAPLPPAPFRGIVTLREPLGFAHLADAPVSRRLAIAAGPARQLARDHISGGTSLFTDTAAGLSSSGFVRIGAGAAARIRRVRAYSTTTDAAGVFRLPPIHRIARAFVTASDAISTVTDIPWVPRRDGPADRLNIELPP